MASTESPSSPGIAVSNNDTIQTFLSLAANDQFLTDEIRSLASDLSTRPTVHYRSLRIIWSTYPVGSRPSLARIFVGSEFAFSSPKPREKSEEPKRRLKELEETAERKAYAELVKDIAPKKGTDDPFSSYKDQIGFGVHVVAIMFTGYLVGHYAFRVLFNHSPVMNAAGGIIGLVGGMLLETLLFMIKASSNHNDMVSSESTANLKKQQ